MKASLAHLAIVVGLLTGCATGYQEAGPWSGGFTDVQLNESMFKVSFSGNEFTSMERAEDLTLLRSAELTLAHGFRYFLIVQSDAHTEESLYTIPATATTTSTGNTTTTQVFGGQTYMLSAPRTTNTIVCFVEDPGDLSYDATMIYRQLSSKYEIGGDGDHHAPNPP